MADTDQGATRRMATIDGNEAAASVAHRLNEVAIIYPITPSSNMGELADQWSAQGRTNIWGTVPEVLEMQSEAGAAGAVHGALQAGSLTTSFTASQGLLLKIPNMYKIAGELTPFVLHVAARALATHALSIFGDQSDVMACRQTGFAMLAANSVQEAHDFACIAQMATLKSRIPFLHFFDGFRTSHEVSRIEMLADDDLRALIDDEAIAAHRMRAMTPDRPVLRGTAQNPDVFFQAREAINPFYEACPDIVADCMETFAARIGRHYRLIDYVGAPDAERVIVMMGSGAEAVHETIEALTAAGEKVGLVKVRLYRPFPIADFVTALPETTRRIAVLDRTKEPGAVGEPLYLDAVAALIEDRMGDRPRFGEMPQVIGGRYGLSSKEFTPAMAKAIYDELKAKTPKRRFTVGINDDVTGLSLNYDPTFSAEPDGVTRAVFYGLGADGTVSANKNAIKIVSEELDTYGQGYFVYDSKKSGAMTVSHLRFSDRPIRSSYLVSQAPFVACHQFSLLDRVDVLTLAAPGATLLLNAPYPPDRLWDELPRPMQQTILDKNLRVFTIDAVRVARDHGLGPRINTIMQACFFKIAGILPLDRAIGAMKAAIDKTYGRRSKEIVEKNFAAVDAALDHLHEVSVPAEVTATETLVQLIPDDAPDLVQKVTAAILRGEGDALPVSAFPVDGTWPTATAKYEKRNIADEIPVWDEAICIQCNKCALVCPHAAIRVKTVPIAAVADAPETFRHTPYRGNEFAEDMRYIVQVAPEDCTGCTLCVVVCPAKDKSNPKHKALDMMPQMPLRKQEAANFEYFLDLPEADRANLKLTPKSVQFLEPLFEFSGACAGCGETPYVKLMSQLFGDRAMIANATGCSSIFGGNLPTTPYAVDRNGRGPTWSNSLFEDNAEFGFGMRVAIDRQQEEAQMLVKMLASEIGDDLATALIDAGQFDEAGIAAQRERVAALKKKLATLDTPVAKRLKLLADYLVRKSVWIVGGDGWAYDIGYGGLDHVMSMPKDINILVLDTGVYSNTGGQQSKATPVGASAKFATAGREISKKDLAREMMSYEHAYVATVAFGSRDAQTVRAFMEAESYPGPSLIIAYSHCIAHGYDLAFGLDQQKLAVESGFFPLMRYDPRRLVRGETPLQLDSPPPNGRLAEFMRNEARFRMVERQNRERYARLLKQAEREVKLRYDLYKYMSGFSEPVEIDDEEEVQVKPV